MIERACQPTSCETFEVVSAGRYNTAVSSAAAKAFSPQILKRPYPQEAKRVPYARRGPIFRRLKEPVLNELLSLTPDFCEGGQSRRDLHLYVDGTGLDPLKRDG